MNLSRSPFSLKADFPVGFPYRFNSRKKHAHTYSNVESLCFPAVKSQQKKKNRFELPRCFQYSLHLITVILTFKSCIFALKLIFVNWIFRHCPFIKVCRQRRKTFLLLYCLFFIFIKVCRQRRKTFLLLYCLFFVIFFNFFSFPLIAFCDFSAIFHRISLIFGQLVDNN